MAPPGLAPFLHVVGWLAGFGPIVLCFLSLNLGEVFTVEHYLESGLHPWASVTLKDFAGYLYGSQTHYLCYILRFAIGENLEIGQSKASYL